MDPNELTNEQLERLKSCKDQSELLYLLDEMGVELSDEQLEAISGGDKWDHCQDKKYCIDVIH